MSEYRLHDDLHLLPTPAGAYAAVANQGSNPVRRLLCSLLRQESTPGMTLKAIEAWTGLTETDALESLYLAQHHHWIEGFYSTASEPKRGVGDTASRPAAPHCR
jgi:hypothetical protein